MKRRRDVLSVYNVDTHSILSNSQVERMLDKTVDGIEYWAINSDHQALSRSKAKGAKTLSIGATVTRGLGAGGDPAKGQLAAEENMAELAEIVEGADLIFITAGMVITRLVSTAPFLCELLMCVWHSYSW